MTIEATIDPAAQVAAVEPVVTPPAAVATPTAVATPAVQVTLPGKDATPADWSKYYADIGAPKDASGYEIPVPEGHNGEFAKEAATAMAKVGLLPNQAKQLATWWNERVGNQIETNKTSAAAAEVARAAAVDAASKPLRFVPIRTVFQPAPFTAARCRTPPAPKEKRASRFVAVISHSQLT